MPVTASEPEAYMDAFMNGFEFVLLAMRGRLAEGALPPAEKERVERFLADYAKLARAYRDRKGAPEVAPLTVRGPVVADLEALAKN